ncbi:hypothetical protein RJ639_006979 [Escallonia herrerae]|uniref:PNPLA domain-containing protein n=1 Tax=Escallonia herrerae TaxID=1293975 RepID=A0AA89ASB2_9ASTE|nr:hypothetical protein RJ639_006979 [Escallonia herrerae]
MEKKLDRGESKKERNRERSRSFGRVGIKKREIREILNRFVLGRLALRFLLFNISSTNLSSAHYLETEDPTGKVREFDLIDGGVAANNPITSNICNIWPLKLTRGDDGTGTGTKRA